MIIEQAFYSLPESFRVEGEDQDLLEARLVQTLGLVLLQELSWRNVSDPLRRIYPEVSFAVSEVGRADLKVTLECDPVQREYGQRPFNWIEAKLFKTYDTKQKDPNAFNKVRALLEAVIRLSALPPEVAGEATDNGRYLLHAYQKGFADHLANFEGRPWLAALTKAGDHETEIDFYSDPSPAIQQSMQGVWTMKVRNLVLDPGDANYTFVLSRLLNVAFKDSSSRTEVSIPFTGSVTGDPIAVAKLVRAGKWK